MRGAAKSPAAARSVTNASAIRSRPTEEDTIQALMDLALPWFGSFGGRVAPTWKPWPVSLNSPASPVPDCATDLARSPSPCVNLDALSSDDAEEFVIPKDFSVRLFCDSEDGHTPVGSDHISSDEDLPSGFRAGDRRQVVRTKDLPSERSVSMGRPADVTVTQKPNSFSNTETVPAMLPVLEVLELSDSDSEPLLRQFGCRANGTDTALVTSVIRTILSPIPGNDCF